MAEHEEQEDGKADDDGREDTTQGAADCGSVVGSAGGDFFADKGCVDDITICLKQRAYMGCVDKC